MMTGVERTESSSRAKAANSRTDSGVAGFSSIMAEQTAAPGASPGGTEWLFLGSISVLAVRGEKTGERAKDGSRRMMV